MERTDPEDRNLKDMSNPKVLKSMNSSCKMVEVVTSPASPSHSTTSSTALKDTPRPNKEPSIEPTRRASHTGEDDVQSSAPTPCANTVILGKRPSRQRDSTNKRRRNEWGHESEDEDDKSVQSATANSASEKVDRTIVPDNRHKGPCSYELCPNPTHSSGGGFKIVTQDTKAGRTLPSCFSLPILICCLAIRCASCTHNPEFSVSRTWRWWCVLPLSWLGLISECTIDVTLHANYPSCSLFLHAAFTHTASLVGSFFLASPPPHPARGQLQLTPRAACRILRSQFSVVGREGWM